MTETWNWNLPATLLYREVLITFVFVSLSIHQTERKLLYDWSFKIKVNVVLAAGFGGKVTVSVQWV